jgi:hypothetical protein
MAKTLRNNTNRRQIFELPHDFVCTDDACKCTVIDRRVRDLNPQTGEYGVKSEQIRAPYAVHLAARATSAPLPDEVVNVPNIAAAISRGILSVD